MDPEYTKQSVIHVRHCIAYKKVIMKVIDTFNMPLVLDKHVFTYIGFFPIVYNFKIQRPLRVYSELEEP